LANVNVYSRKFITITDTRFKKGTYAYKIKNMPLPPPKYRTAYGTYLYFAEPGVLETCMRDYRQILKTNFQKITIESGGNIGTAVRTTIPGIGTGNPGSILSGCVVSRVLMILP
jgi:predicted oxidoreductase (fatty acid repression mutant protein)